VFASVKMVVPVALQFTCALEVACVLGGEVVAGCGAAGVDVWARKLKLWDTQLGFGAQLGAIKAASAGWSTPLHQKL
jgi:hypothetical protein